MRRYLGLIAVVFLWGCDAAPVGVCKPGDDVICGILRPEDIELVPDTPWLMVSEQGGIDRPGRIVLVNPVTNERRILAEATPPLADASSFPRCGVAPEKLRPRGFHLAKGDDGALHLLVIAGARVERYRANIAGSDVSLDWEGCVDIPKELTANDIAALPGEGFVISHMYNPPRDAFLNFKMVFGLNTGYVAKWTPESGWSKVPNSDVSFANGIQVDPATSRIYVSSMFTQRIVMIDLDGSHRVDSARSPIQTDNLSWADDGRLIGAGHTGFPVYGITACRDKGDAPCSFPFAVVAFDPKTLNQELLFRTPTGAIPGASVAVVRGPNIYLGSAFGDRISHVTSKP